MTLMAFQGSVEMGLIFAIMALGVFISFRTLNVPDLTVDGSFVLGAAVSVMVCISGYPFIGLLLAFIAGCGAGCITSFLNTKLKIQPILAGILTQLALYSVNLRIMDNKANVSLLNQQTIFTVFENTVMEKYAGLMISFLFVVFILAALFLFLITKVGFALRATGDNENMVRAQGINTDYTKLLGLALSNGLVAVSGGVYAQYQSFADISMGVGMVVIALASVIVGEVIFGTSTLLRKLTAVILGSILYRVIIAFALGLGMPPTDLKLVSAVIVAIALSITTIKEKVLSIRKRRIAGKGGQVGAER